MNIIFFLRNCIFAILLFAVYFQVPFIELRTLISPMVALYFFLSFQDVISFIKRKHNFIFLLSGIVLLLINLSIVIINGGDVVKGARFLAILVLILLAFGTENKKDADIQYKIFMLLTICKVIFLVYLAVTMIMYGDYMWFRNWAILNDYGDMYFVYDVIPRIQIFGNSLLVVALLVEVFSKNKITALALFIILGVLIAGNLSFIIAVFVLLAYIYRKKFLCKISIKSILWTIVLVVCFLLFVSYIYSENEKKVDNNAIRSAQIEFLIDMDNIFFGNGLGEKVPKMRQIGYPEDSLYYEVQSAYIFYQIGLVGFLWFVAMNFILAMQYKNTNLYVFYGIYVLSACSNPYFFDTTHVLAVHFFVNIFAKDKT